MKPYLVQRVEYDPAAHGQRPAAGTAPVFVLAPSPKAAAVKACRFRQVHEGRGFLRLRVMALEDQTALTTGPVRDYGVRLEARVVGCEAS